MQRLHALARISGFASQLARTRSGRWNARLAAPSIALAFVGLLAAAFAPPAHAQCAEPDATFALPGVPGEEAFITSFDAGDGAKLYSAISSFNGPARVVRWTGTRWETVFERLIPGTPFDGGEIGCLRATIDGATPVLFVTINEYQGGGPSEIWRWDGSVWTQLPNTPSTALEIEFLDDGTGVALTAGGRATFNTGAVWRLVAGAWVQVGANFTRNVHHLVSFDGGSGTQLYAFANTLTACTAAVWDGATWVTLPAPNWAVRAARVYDSGGGRALYIGTGTTSSPGFWRWNGSGWSSVSPLIGEVDALEVVDWGSGPVLAISGARRLSSTPSLWGVLFFDGTSFTATGPSTEPPFQLLKRLALVDDGATRRLYVSGNFGVQGGVRSEGLVAWDGATWSTLGHGIIDDPSASSTTGNVRALAAFDFGNGAELVAAGSFRSAGYSISESNGALRWSAGQWSGTGNGPGFDTYCLARVEFPGGAKLFAGGGHTDVNPAVGVKTWNGANWTQPSATWGDVHALTSFGSGASTRLIAGGNFTVISSVPANRIAQYDGATWTTLGTGMDDIVAALCEVDLGGGNVLMAAGNFTQAGGAAASHVASWNGSAWSPLGAGANGGVNALCAFDDGNGVQLYAGGAFSHAGGMSVSNLARWNGSTWSSLPGGGTNGAVLALHVRDDGRGPALYVGGGFSVIGGISASNVARFDGANWESVGTGTDGVVNAFASLDDDGDGDAELYLGGNFLEAFGMSSARIARVAGCPHFTAFCSGDGAFADHTTPCPCGNNGAPGHGCANSFVSAGAVLGASGSTFVDDVTLTVNDTPQSSFAIYLQHDALDDRTFHDGVLCAGGHLIRLRNRFSVGGQSSFPDTTFAQDATTTLSQRGQVSPGSGASRYYSLFYRNASSTFCPPALANVSNGVRVVW